MEKRIKINNKIETNRDANNYHKKINSQENLNIKYYQVKDNNKEHKSNLKNSNIKNKSGKIASIGTKKEHKHHHHHHKNRSTSMDPAKKEKNYFKYKLDNFGKEKEKKEKEKEIVRYKLFDLNNNIPKNVDKNTEKYYTI